MTLNWETAEIKQAQYVRILKSLNFDAVNISGSQYRIYSRSEKLSLLNKMPRLNGTEFLSGLTTFLLHGSLKRNLNYGFLS